MEQVKCIECGRMFDDNMASCPNCGCPYEPKKQKTSNQKEQNGAKTVYIHENFNEKVPYSPFKSDSWMFKDPWPLKNYPIGKLNERYPLLAWLFGPWHLTCKNEEEQEEYAVINNIFYLFNLLFKIQGYAMLWNLCKLHIFLILWIIPILNIFCIIMYIVAIGKALHRYWSQLHRVFRRLNKRYWNSMLNKES